ncbi:essential IMV membrane protein [Eastern grey kangaroopox virus]|uniref:Essential IMV membrane protein n=1 Tax=Eastern grey kangaroopox virus TaxID=2042482 RepID=A0A2C9DT82_9POXV|nr:essential IMV membrane protein [Eastern grey kangaroopox virus]ATI21215.1 essential IMV membrane protein [Eastern grey kangaroopox virus]ATX75121.1 essential IMV membrane protein [Eastern grey kangaroopox virus]
MDIIRSVKNNYSNLVVLGIVLLILSCVFAFVDFSKTVRPHDLVWRNLCILAFALSILVILGILLFSGYGRFCAPSAKIISDDGRFRSSELELNGQ